MEREARHILVVEDDYLQALEIGRFIRGTGGQVLGPVATMEHALSLVPKSDAAVLDIDLSGKLVFPLADELVRYGIPIIFYTNWPGDKDLPRRFWSVPLIRKPVNDIRDAAIVALAAHSSGSQDDIRNILPKLRVAARLIYTDPSIADRLVERLLKDAIEFVGKGNNLGEGDAKVRWLIERMRGLLDRQGTDLMN